MTQRYDVRDWFWIVGGDTTRAWSSASGAYVTTWPAERVTQISSEAELGDVLRPFGLSVPAPTQQDYADAIESHMETVAQSRGYQDADRLASYTTSGNATWSAEAVTFSAWRDAVWAYSFEQMAAVQSGVRQAPTVDGLIAELPAIDWQEFPITELQVALDRIVALEQALGEFATRLNAQ